MQLDRLIRCFFDDAQGAYGNLACVGSGEGAGPRDARHVAEALAAAASADVTSVVISPADEDWRVESFTAAGNPIRFCGHGALAAGFALLDSDPHATSLMCSNEYQRWVVSRDVEGWVSLRFSLPNVCAVETPAWLADWLGAAVRATGHAGGEAGYLIAQLDDPVQLDDVTPRFEQLAHLTSHAVIVTAMPAENDAADVSFRYFAPQYGVCEDTATGSAAVQLAAWWQLQSGVEELVLHQRSLSGGWLYTRCHTDTVELRGRVAYR